MTIAFVNSGSGSGDAVTSLTYALDVGSGADRVVVVTATEFASINLASGTCTYGGVSLGSPVVQSVNVGNNRTFVWAAITTLTGSNNVVITPPSTAYIDSFASSWSGVDQTTPVDASASWADHYTNTPQSLSISVSSGGVAVDQLSIRTPALTPAPNGTQTQIGSILHNGFGSTSTGASYKAAATAMVWTFPSQDNVSHAVVALKAASGGAFSLTSDQGSLSLTGQTASLKVARTLTADQGSYSLTGQNAALTYLQPGVYTLTANQGSYLITGSDGLAQRAMNAEFGSYTLSGQDVSFSSTTPQDYSMPCEFGLYSYTGRSARLIWSGAPASTNVKTLLNIGMRIGL